MPPRSTPKTAETTPPTAPLDGDAHPMEDAQEYRKTALVKALRVDEPFQVETLEGTMTGNAGDYLCEGSEGERWPIKREIFEATYAPAEEFQARYATGATVSEPKGTELSETDVLELTPATLSLAKQIGQRTGSPPKVFACELGIVHDEQNGLEQKRNIVVSIAAMPHEVPADA